MGVLKAVVILGGYISKMLQTPQNKTKRKTTAARTKNEICLLVAEAANEKKVSSFNGANKGHIKLHLRPP